MPLFELKSITELTIENAKEDYRASKRVEQFRYGAEAIYFPAFPGTQYLPYKSLTKVKSKNTAVSVAGTCGKQIPMVCLRLYYGDTFKDFMLEKKKSEDMILEAIAACCPELEIDRDNSPLNMGI
ncbi:MAG: hypothetical protein IJE09_03690 [Oscillospiraceae bacterium]|nr:hypothetical protein [Oscillospiraceae bacterium]